MALGDDSYRWGSPTVYSNDLVARAAYAAGIIDGEGYIGIVHTKPHGDGKLSYHRVSIQVSNRDVSMIDFLNRNFGGHVDYIEYPHHNSKCQSQYRWTTTGRNAVDFLQFIYPYLITKKEQARIAIEMQKTVSQYDRVSAETLILRESLKQKLHALNKRGR